MEFDMQHLNIDERGPIYSSLLRPFTVENASSSAFSPAATPREQEQHTGGR
jgi:hypothetical protein